MAVIQLPYGHGSFSLSMQDDQILAVVEANKLDLPALTPEQAVREALRKPIASPGLDSLVKKGEKICILVPDITRVFECPFVSVPLLVEQLNGIGIPDQDLTILFANGGHKAMTADEHQKLIGAELARRIKTFDHQCHERENLAHMGTTSRGTPVYFNKHAVNADKIITVCGVIYHFLAGFGGGGKMLLPGIAGYETIQANHKLALNKGFGNGLNPEARSGNLTASNPFHADIFEAAAMLPPVFSLNVVTNSKAQIIRAYAGDWIAAHKEACELVARMDGARIPGRAELVIASSGGYPKDINLYQGIKTITNALGAARAGGVIIALLQCPDGFGNADTQKLLCAYETMNEREKELRENFSIGAFAGYFIADAATKTHLILVTDMPAADFGKTAVQIAPNLDEALKLAGHWLQNKASCIIMPHGAATLPLTE